MRGTEFTEVAWTHEVLDDLTEAALLAYLAVAHHGRGRGDWAPAAAPEHWRQAVTEAMQQTSAARQALWSERSATAPVDLQPALERELTAATRLVLQKLYPKATFPRVLPTPRA